MKRTACHSNLTDSQWASSEPLLTSVKVSDHPRTTDVSEVVNTLPCRRCNNVGWRALPHDPPSWRAVYHCFRASLADGTWERIHEALAWQVGTQAGRAPTH